MKARRKKGTTKKEDSKTNELLKKGKQEKEKEHLVIRIFVSVMYSCFDFSCTTGVCAGLIEK